MQKSCYSEQFVYALRQKVAVTDRPATVTNRRDVIFSATEGKQHQQAAQAAAGAKEAQTAGVSASFVEFLSAEIRVIEKKHPWKKKQKSFHSVSERGR